MGAFRWITAVSLLGSACGCGGSVRDPLESALNSMDVDALLENTRILSSDEFEGRRPGTLGEDRTVTFLAEQFRNLGLAPGNPDGGWTQEVRLVGLRAERKASISVDGQITELSFPNDFMALTRHVTPEVAVKDSEIVFVGYGIVAPEYGWDDYKDLDVTGKTILMLVNDPGFATQDPALFRGNRMTYYGRWTYKFEIATERGAAAAIIIHETEPAGYPWEVVTSTWEGENLDIVSPDGNRSRVPVEAWLHHDVAERMLAAAGLQLDSLKRAASRRDFRPVAVGAQGSFQITNQIRDMVSRNVVARLVGTDSEKRDEYIVYTAHWDGFGVGAPDANSDSIYSGALDNATGTAGLLELARAFLTLPQAPDRSILFLAVTAEEYGLLGAKHYAAQPLFPLEKTLANINVDGLNQWGRTTDIVVIGHGSTTLEDILSEEAERRGRRVVPDPEPEKGYFYRSDHFELAKQGVPALFHDDGIDYLGRPEGWGVQRRSLYIQNDYHKPSDDVKQDWDLSGAIEDLQLLFLVGHRVAMEDRWPEWKDGSEFRARRLEMLGRRL